MNRQPYTIVIPSYRRGGLHDRHLWDDLRICLASVEAYAPEASVLVGWDGPFTPDRILNKYSDYAHLELLERPTGLSGTAAFNWLVERAQTERVIMLNDDAVLHPSTMRLLTEDWTELADGPPNPGRPNQPPYRIGLLGCRSNFVAGAGNIRQPNGGVLGGIAYSTESSIISVDVVFPVCAMFERTTYLEAGGLNPNLNWYSDNLLCYDLCKKGYRHFVSRAYVHHIGMRGTMAEGSQGMVDENARGLAWLKENRPDYYAVIAR